MKNLNILIVEGNLKEENQNFLKVGIQTHTESLKDSLNVFNNIYHFDVINPSSDQNLDEVKNKLPKYDGLIWGGSSLNIYNNTPEIKRQIEFMRECQKQVKNILAICWGMQVAVTAAGGEVKKAEKSHIGIANEIIINNEGLNNSIYKNKNNNFNSPASNFDEVVKLPTNGICLASNKINKVQSLYFKVGKSKIYGLQYHPEIPYSYMIRLLKHRKKRLLDNKSFKDENELNKHIDLITKEDQITNDNSRTLELKNWLDHIKKS